MTGQFAVRKSDDGDGLVVLAVRGEIDHDVSEALATILSNAVAQDGVRHLVIDLERVSFLAAAGVRCLLDGRAAALGRGCSFRVVSAHGMVEQVLRAAGTADLVGPAPVTDRQRAGGSCPG